MAWRDLMVRVGMEAKGFKQGASDISKSTGELRAKITDLSRTMTQQQERLRELGRAGKGASTEYKSLKAEIASNRAVLSAYKSELSSVSLTQKNLASSTNSMGSAWAAARGPLVALFAGASISEFMRSSAEAYDGQEKALAQVRAGLISTGNQVGVTFKKLKQESEDLQKTTLFGDEEILQKATAQLLTFTKITGDNFLQAQRAAMDLAARLDGDLQSAAIMVGKALNDPIKGLNAMGRAGVQFTKEQKETIKSLVETNRLAEAQTIILNELAAQYGGSAEAAAKAGMGGFTQMKNAIGDMQEEIGKLVVMSLAPLAKDIKEWAEKAAPQIRESITGFRKLVAAISAVENAIDALLVSISTGTWLSPLDAFKRSFRKDVDDILKDNARLAAENIGLPSAQFDRAGRRIGKAGTGGTFEDSESEGISGNTTAKIKTASSLYREFQQELQKTRDWLKFVGEENKYVGIAAEKTAAKMKEMFMSGTAEAKAYADTLKRELAALTQLKETPVQPIETREAKATFDLDLGSKEFVEKLQAHAQIVSQLGDEIRWAEQEALAFGDTYDLLGTKIQSVSSAITASIRAGFTVDTTQLQDLIEQLRVLQTEKQKLIDIEVQAQEQAAMTGEILSGVGGIMNQVFSSISGSNNKAVSAVLAFGNAAITAGIQAAKGGLAAATGEQAKTNSKFGLPGVAMAAAAITAIIALVQQGLGSARGLRLAKGGMAFGETLATIGDNPGARFDPEVVSPLSKLKEYIGDRAVEVMGTLRASGDDLVAVLENTNRKTKAFRG